MLLKDSAVLGSYKCHYSFVFYTSHFFSPLSAAVLIVSEFVSIYIFHDFFVVVARVGECLF